MTNELDKLQADYNVLAQRAEPWHGTYGILTERHDDGSSYVEFVDGEYHFIATERGVEISHQTTTDLTEILYWLISDLTFWLAVQFELKHRVDGQDCRRIMFEHWQKLMDRIEQRMAARLKDHIAKTLAANPFID
ncbi:MAG: Imm63 family immunity protein [Pyrinomonadaceae bacterium]